MAEIKKKKKEPGQDLKKKKEQDLKKNWPR